MQTPKRKSSAGVSGATPTPIQPSVSSQTPNASVTTPRQGQAGGARRTSAGARDGSANATTPRQGGGRRTSAGTRDGAATINVPMGGGGMDSPTNMSPTVAEVKRKSLHFLFNEQDARRKLSVLSASGMLGLTSGRLLVTVKRATNIVAKQGDGSADAYVRLKGPKEKYRTTVKKRTTNPVWNTDLLFHIHNCFNDRIDIQIFNKGIFGSDDAVGRALTLQLSKLPRGVPRPVDLDCDKGVLHLEVFAIDFGRDPKAWETMWTKPEGVTSGRLLIHVNKATGVQAKDANGFSDPFVTVDGPCESVRTTVKNRTLEPVWEEDFIMHIKSASDVLTVTLYDADRMGDPNQIGKKTRLYLNHLEQGTPEDTILDTEFGLIYFTLIALDFGHLSAARRLSLQQHQQQQQRALIDDPMMYDEDQTGDEGTDALELFTGEAANFASLGASSMANLSKLQTTTMGSIGPGMMGSIVGGGGALGGMGTFASLSEKILKGRSGFFGSQKMDQSGTVTRLPAGWFPPMQPSTLLEIQQCGWKLPIPVNSQSEYPELSYHNLRHRAYHSGALQGMIRNELLMMIQLDAIKHEQQQLQATTATTTTANSTAMPGHPQSTTASF